jgi:hypothetical protein
MMSGLSNAGGTMGMSGMTALANQNIVDRAQQTQGQQASNFLGQQYQAERGLQQASEDTAERTRQTAIQGGAQVQGQKNIAGGMGAQAKASVIGARIRGMLGTGSVLGQEHQFNVNNALLPSEFALNYMNASAPYQGSPQGGWQGMLGGIGSGMAMGGGIGGKYFGNSGGGTNTAGGFSDEALKDNIHRTDLEVIPGVVIATWDWKDSGEPDIGVIAQDLEKVRPEMVGERDGYKTVDYAALNRAAMEV